MNKVHLTVEVGEEIFDEASIQTLKEKARELASAGQSINRSYARTKQIQKYVEDAILPEPPEDVMKNG